ncbi:CHAT domain-containing protein [Xanthomarina sp. F2636L]|uniref:CHAT domain-containing protein n=1 Tax=Xanthomarina sp. F2636L TaxID=2996018 RepID=UPI00225E152D|nr:CHAT domain-containing tetratricopeptide repeat protein [Xanthomarina sp. F2636L]MCX7550804.1 CHAT domain-containing protein [Xanthomarina sp. F2636L]
MNRDFCYFSIFLLLSLFLIQNSQGQTQDYLNLKTIDSFLLKGSTKKADSTVNAQLAYIKTHNLTDSLYNYPYYIGKIELLNSNAKNASIKAEAFLKSLNNQTKNKHTYYKALLDLANFYDEIGNNTKSLEHTKLALEIVNQTTDATLEEIGKVEYNVGATYLSLGNVGESKIYFKKALTHYEAYPSTSKEQLSDGYNAVGATMWMSSKLDSAKYFYSKAIKAINSSKGNPLKNLYLVTVIESNLSLLEYTQGNLSEAIDIQNQVILNYETVINNYQDDNIVSKAKRFQARAISNLAVFYNEQGNLKKAYELIVYAYEKKKTLVEATDASLPTNLIQIGQSQLSLKEFDDALVNLHKGLEQLNNIHDDNPYWKAAANHALAEAYAAKDNIPLAMKYYNDSELLFKIALDNTYDKEFLSFLRNKALFLAENNQPEEALAITTNAYNYIIENGGENNFDVLKQFLNLVKVNYTIKDYSNTLRWVDEAKNYLNKVSPKADSIQIEFNKPELILLETSAKYFLNSEKDSVFLQGLVKDLNKATSILEKRKTTIYKHEDINILLSDYQAISSFEKKIILELYTKTQNSKYLNKLISLHESSIYNRIRSRLNLKNNLSFSHIPKQITDRENNIKNKLTASLEGTGNMNDFIHANKEWDSYLDSLKQMYPRYYKMRYGTIEESLTDIKKHVPENTTVIRYLFIDTQLYAFVIDNSQTNLFKLQFTKQQNTIQKLLNNILSFQDSNTLINTLYKQLWEPMEANITTKNVVIIPDEELFNLSFEILTDKQITSYSELATHSLLSKYIISYNYSLFLIDNKSKPMDYKDNFIAFVPEFNDKMKENYHIKIEDSLDIDKTYLTLLPQPFTKDLAKKSSQLFKGESFLNEKSTEHIFKNSAKEHKIIHIGTHAESNNLSPELSRLVFAKSTDTTGIDDGYLFTYEIYNTNLSSNLAILTACETGKPTYQAGEGMISLAHAFNYAGSESIVTSLWKVDEQSSTEIIALFYNNIKKGMAKDSALQQAKLEYLKNAKGRTINPQYWAGLVLIGDTTPIDISTSSNGIFWITGIIILFILLFIIIRKQRNK